MAYSKKEKILIALVAVAVLSSSVDFAMDKISGKSEEVTKVATVTTPTTVTYRQTTGDLADLIANAGLNDIKNDSLEELSLKGIALYGLSVRNRVEAVLAQGDNINYVTEQVGNKVLEDTNNGVSYKVWRDEFFGAVSNAAATE